MESGFRRAERDVGQGGDFGQGHAINEAQQEDFAVVHAEVGDDVVEVVIPGGVVGRSGELIESGRAGFAADEAAGSSQRGE